MEKALVKVGSLKAGTFWVSKKAKEEISNISQDLSKLLRAVGLFAGSIVLMRQYGDMMAI